MLKLLAFHVLTLALFAVISTVDIVVQRWLARRTAPPRHPARKRPWRTALRRAPTSHRRPRGTGRATADAGPPATPPPFPAQRDSARDTAGPQTRPGRARGTSSTGERRGVRDA
jgi:hypothetical protein